MKKLLLTLAVLMVSITAAFAEVLSGSCGTNVTYTLDTETGVLKIEGTGAMRYYYSPGIDAPWYSYRTYVKKVQIAQSVTSIGGSAFYDCSSLTSVIIPESVTSIGERAFYRCFSLTSATIPESVTNIGDNAFYGCSGLTSIIVDPNNTTYDSRNNCNALIKTANNEIVFGCKNTIIPEGVTSIGYNAFSGCSSLTSVIIPESVTSIGERAFSDCSSLTSITIPEGVTSIEGYTFWECSSLTSITIPSSMTSIGSYAFWCCSSLTSVIIPESVTNIGGSAFYGCSSLTSVIIPESVTSIGERAFSDCSSLTSITIPEGVTSIGSYTFEGCSLSSVTIPESVTSIGSYAFNNCSSLTSINIPSSVASIREYAFSGCSSLTSIIIPESVTSIGNDAFQNCSSLTTITIPSSVMSIGSSAFYGCRSLTSITISQGVTSIGSSAFYGCSSLTSITIPSSVTSIGDYAFSGSYCLSSNLHNNSSFNLQNYGLAIYDGEQTDGLLIRGNMTIGCRTWATSITIPEGVTSIGYGTFQFCRSLTSITIPESVTSIGNDAFCGCSSLTSITVPDGVTSIGDYAFSGCSKLTSVTIPEGVTSIGSYTFNGCRSLTSITISQGVTSIGNHAFGYCSSLSSITIPESVTSIGISAFYGSALTSITIPEGVTSIGYDTFQFCRSLTSITVPDGVTSIGDYAFSGCSSLTTISIPSSVTSIGSSAFKGSYCLSSNLHNNSSFNLESYGLVIYDVEQADGLLIKDNMAVGCRPWGTSITIPEGVTSIGSTAFYQCSSLTSITIPSSVTSIRDRAFSYCSSLTSITVPDGVTSIGDYAFSGCSSLTSATISEGVTSIGNYAFLDCSSLNSITIPSSVKSIRDRAFWNCSSLTDITCLAATPPTCSSSSFSTYGILHVLPDYGNAYRAKSYWKKFAIVEDAEDESKDNTIYILNKVENKGSVDYETSHHHLFRTAAEAMQGSHLFTLSQDNNTIDLDSWINVHAVFDQQLYDGVYGGQGTINRQGYKLVYELKDYDTSGNPSENPFAKIEGSSIVLKSQSELNSLSSTDISDNSNTPLVCVKMIDTNHHNNVVAEGYFKIVIIPTYVSFTFSLDVDVKLAGGDDVVIDANLLTEEMVKEALMSVGFFRTFHLEGSGAVSSSSQAGTFLNLKVRNGEAYAAFSRNVNMSITVRYVNSELGMVIPVTINLKNKSLLTIPVVRITEADKTSNWFAHNSTMMGYDEVHSHLIEGTLGSSMWVNRLDASLWRLGSTPASLYEVIRQKTSIENLLVQYKFVSPTFTQVKCATLRDSYNQPIVATLEVSEDGTKLYARSSVFQKTVIATLDPNNCEIEYMQNDVAGEVLNWASHSELGNGETLTARVGISASAGDPIGNLTIYGGEFDVKFLRPLSFSSNQPEVIDAIPGVYDVEAQLSFTDWRGWDPEWFAQGTNGKDFAEFYGLRSIKMDESTPIMTDYASSGRFVAMNETLRNYFEFAVDEDSPIVIDEDYKARVVVKYIKHAGEVASRFQARIPVLLEYAWGKLRSEIVVTVKPMPIVQSTLTFLVDGETYSQSTVSKGAAISLPEPPTKDGYTFKGWEGLPEDMLMPSNDLTVTAIFEIILGDVNGDNEIDVADLSAIASYILGHPSESFVEMAADVNKDNEIDVADIAALSYLILHPETAQKAKARKVAEKKENIENAYNTLYAEMLQAEAGTDVVLPIMMRNSIEATGFQLDLVLPEGVTLKEAALSNVRTTSKRTNLFDYAHQADGTYRILCNSTKGLSFNGHDGEVMLITLHIDKEAELGAQTIALKDMVLTDATGMLREESSLSESTLWVGNATGIYEMASEKDAPTYDLQGRKMSKKQKGIHIQNGKKKVMK